MERVPPFRKRDLTRAIRAVEAAGLTVGRVEVSKDGKLTLIPAGQQGEANRASESPKTPTTMI
jgi:hypothetical protein